MSNKTLNGKRIAENSIDAIQKALLSEELSAIDIAHTALDDIAKIDPELHCFLQVSDDIAIKKAGELNNTLNHFLKSYSMQLNQLELLAKAREHIGTLFGVPVAFKDNMNMLGTRTTCGSKMLADYESTFQATCVSKVIDAGAIPLGKLNMDEFAFGSSTETSYFGATLNPWDKTCVPGGSSGGSAAAVGAGLAAMTLGSDTGGSIRQPAAFCGVVGFKPTYGMISRYGVVAFGSSLDQVGPFTRSVFDCALSMNALCGKDLLDCTSQNCALDFTENLEEGIDGLAIGVVPEFMDAEGMTDEVRFATQDVIKKLESLGARIIEVALPNTNAAMSAYYVIGPCEAFSNLSRFDSVRYGNQVEGASELGEQYELSRADGFGAEARRRIMLGSYLLSSGIYDTYYYPAQQIRTLITEDYRRAYEEVSVIVLPTSPRTAFKLGEIADPTSMYLSDMFTIALNIAGNGGMSLPICCGRDSGLPIGIQIVGPQFQDQNIFRVAAALEQSVDFYGGAL